MKMKHKLNVPNFQSCPFYLLGMNIAKKLLILVASLALILGHTVPVATTMARKRHRDDDDYQPGEQPAPSQRASAARLARAAQSPTDLTAQRQRNAAQMRLARTTIITP